MSSKPATPPVKKAAGKSVEDFRALHDKSYIVPRKIRAAIEALGPEGWEYELGFLKLAGLSTTDMAAFRDQFEEFIVSTPGHNPKRIWAGSKALAEKLRAMV
jgi:hypothetical protein